jgi:hypothetical protein
MGLTDNFRLIPGIALVLLMTAFTGQAQDTTIQIDITSPGNGEQVSGLVEIRGTANDTAQFTGYQLWFALNDTDQWFPITGPEQTPVQDGQLGQWDTTALPSGLYAVRLQVFLSDGEIATVEVGDIQVIPTSEDTQTNEQPPTIAPTDIPALAPTAVPVVATLPSADLPAPEPVDTRAEATTSDTADEPGAAIGRALLVGITITSAIFLVMGIYTFVRRQIRNTISGVGRNR